MALNNLRIVYDNKVHQASSLLASSAVASTPVTNLKTEKKSAVWRSLTTVQATTKANLVLTFSNPTALDTFVLFGSNITSTATIRIRGFTGSAATPGTGADPVATTPGTLQVDSTATVAAPYGVLGTWQWGTTELGSTPYTYGKPGYARVYIPLASTVACTSYLIEIVDADNTDKYIEASALIAGNYWSPKYNTSYGLSTGVVDSSTNKRSEAGDIISIYGPKHNTLKFKLDWLTDTDRAECLRMFQKCGKSIPLFISLFPENTEDYNKELSHQIYGKLMDISDLEHPVLSLYKTSVNIEEL